MLKRPFSTFNLVPIIIGAIALFMIGSIIYSFVIDVSVTEGLVVGKEVQEAWNEVRNNTTYIDGKPVPSVRTIHHPTKYTLYLQTDKFDSYPKVVNIVTYNKYEVGDYYKKGE